MQVAATKLTVNNNILLELFETEVLQLELTLSHSGNTEFSTFDVKTYVRRQFINGNDFIDIERLKQHYPYLPPILLRKRSIDSGSNMSTKSTVRAIWTRPKRYFDRHPTPVRLGFKSITTFDLYNISYMLQSCNTDCERLQFGRSKSKLVQHGIVWCLWSDWPPFCLRFRMSRGQNVLEDITSFDGCWYQVVMLQADEKSSLPNNYFFRSSAVKVTWTPFPWELLVEKQLHPNNKSDLVKSYIVKVDKKGCTQIYCPRK